MAKNIIAVVAGYVLWAVIFLGGGAAIRALRPDVHDANGITSDTSTLLLYLIVSVAASLSPQRKQIRVLGFERTEWATS